MQAFDFDDTLYKGESTFDFALFVIKKNKRLIKHLPGILRALGAYKLCLWDEDKFLRELEKYTKVFLENKDLLKELTQEFWLSHEKNLYLNMLEKVKFNDVIITASPEFLMMGIKDRLNTKHILCTKIDFDKGKITWLNFGKNKVLCFKKVYKNKKIKNFYTDSYNDKPFMDFSDNVYLVSHGESKKIK